MPIHESQITDEMLNTAAYNGAAQVDRLAALLNLPGVRQLIRETEQHEHADMMAGLPGWDELSDLDKGAALMHLWKRDSEGDDYAIENYPAKFIEDPRLTVLDHEDACDHAARFEEIAEELDPSEHSRLYDLALNHERSN